MESRIMTLIKNLNQAAHCHKDDCHNEQCGVSLYLIKEAAKKLSEQLINTEEQVEVVHMKWPS